MSDKYRAIKERGFYWISRPNNGGDVGHFHDIADELNRLQAHIKRLEEAGKNLRECASWLGYAASQYGNNIIRAKAAIEAWDKESKP